MPRTSSPLPVLLAAAFVVGLDFFIVNVALPSMQADLDAGSAAVQLWVAGYGAALGALLILGSRLGDLHGRRKLFVIGLAGFTAASAACGLAPDATTLVVARLAQGATAALLMPQILAVIGTVYTEPAAQAKAIAAYGLTAGLAAVSGQLVGGILIETDLAGLGWRACFLVNVPIGIAAVLVALRTVPESRAPGAAKLDLLSVDLVTVGIGALVFGLAMGQERGWPLWTILLLDAALVLLAAFALRQRRLARTGRDALIDPALWRRPGFTAGATATLAFQLGLASTFFVLARGAPRGARGGRAVRRRAADRGDHRRRAGRRSASAPRPHQRHRGAHPGRAADRRAGRRRAEQPADRAGLVRHREDGRRPPVQRLPQARHRVPGPARGGAGAGARRLTAGRSVRSAREGSPP